MVTTTVTAKPTTRVYCYTEMNNLFNEAGLLFNDKVLTGSNNVIVMFNNMRLKKTNIDSYWLFICGLYWHHKPA